MQNFEQKIASGVIFVRNSSVSLSGWQTGKPVRVSYDQSHELTNPVGGYQLPTANRTPKSALLV
jgi:hypothetical protein